MAQEIVRFTTGSSTNIDSTAKQAGRVYFAVDSNNTTGSIYYDKDATHRVRMSAPALTEIQIDGEQAGLLTLSPGATSGTITVKRNTFVVGNGSTTGAWTGSLDYTGVNALYDGFEIDFWINIAGSSSGTTLNLTLSNGASTGALPVYYGGTTRLTNHYGVNNVIHLVYRDCTIGSTAYKGWWCYGNYYVNDYYRLRYNANVKAKTAIVAGNLITGTNDGYQHLNTGNAFDINYPVLYAGSAISAGSTNTNAHVMINFTVSTTQSITLTAYKPVYIKGTLNGTTFTPVSTTPLTQTVPTSEDGYDYINIGMAYSSTAMYLLPDQKIYHYLNNKFQEVTQTAEAAILDNLGNSISNYVNDVTLSGHTLTFTRGDGNNWDLTIPDNDTKNTAGSTNSTSKLFVIGATSQAANPQTYSNSAVYIQNGNLTASKFIGPLEGNADTATKATNDSLNQQITTTYVSGLSLSGYTLTVTKGDGGTSTITLPDSDTKNTTGSTQSTAKIYLVGAETQATSAQTYSNGAIYAENGELTANKFIGQLQGNADTATKATYDSLSQQITTTYISSLALSGHTLTITKGSGGETTLTLPDNDTKNTAGSTNTTSKIYIIGATSQAANPQTYSNSAVFIQNGNLTASKFIGPLQGNADTATVATNDSLNQEIITTYLSGLSLSGHTLTLTKGDGGTSTITLPDSDTKNTTGSTQSTAKIYLVGAETQAASAQTYSNTSVYAQSGNLTAAKFIGPLQGNADSATKATNDSLNQQITTTYVSSISITGSDTTDANGTTAITAGSKGFYTVTKGDGGSVKTALPIASATVAGIVVNTAQTWAGTKTFSTGATISGSGGFNYSGIQAGTANQARVIWFADTAGRGKPVYDDDFTYNPSTNTLTVTNINGTIEQAKKDSLGQVITETYISDIIPDVTNHKITLVYGDGGTEDKTLGFVKLAGDTMTGNLTVNHSNTTDSIVKVQNSNGAVSLLASTNRGLYDATGSNWMIYRKSSETTDRNTYILANTSSASKEWKFDTSGKLTTPSGATTTANLIGTATRAINDENGVAITTYIDDLSIDGKTITATRGSGATFDLDIDLAETANGASIATNTNALAYYTDTDGTFGNLRSTAGAFYSTGQDVKPQFGTLPITYGGTNITSYSTGEMLYASAANTLSKLAVGAEGQVLRSDGTYPTWSNDRGIEFIVGTWTAASGTWTGVSADAELYDGKQIILYMPFNGSGNATLNLTLANGTTTGAKNVYFESTTRFTTHKGQNSQLHLIYHNALKLSNGTTYQGWWYVTNRDTTTTNATQIQFNATGSIKAGASALVAGNIIVADTDGLYKHLKAGTVFDITNPILYLSSAVAANATSSSVYSEINFTVTTTQSLSLTAYKPVFIKGTLSGNRFTPASTAPLTQIIPTNDDGYVYIYLGWAYASTTIRLQAAHPLYWFKNGAFRVYSPPSATAALESTTNAVAYYTDTSGTFGSLQSNNGALYATGQDGALNFGTLPIAQGGTGKTTAAGIYEIVRDNGGDGRWVKKAGDTITGNINRYYGSASTDPMFSALSNNLDIYLWEVGHGTAAAATTTSNHYKLLYKGTGASPNNYLQLIAHNTSDKVAYQIDENGLVTFPQSSGFTYSGIGAASDNAERVVWFAYNGVNGRPVYDNDFKYNPSTNQLHIVHASGKSGEFRTTYGSTVDMWLGIGSGDANHGLYDAKADKWMIYADTSGNVTVNGNITGNAATATKFASAQSVTLTGDVTGTASSQAGWSVATTLANSGVTAGSYGPSAGNNALAAVGGTFSVPYITVDAKGRTTAASTKSFTLTVGNGTITNAMLANSSMSIAGNTVSLGGSLSADTLRSSLGLSSAMHFIGIATVAITDGGTQDPTISGYDFTNNKKAGDVIIDSASSMEYVWTGTAWERLGSETSFKTIQTAVSSPTASGTTTSFIDTISQDTNGVITATKKTITTATTSAYGMTKLTDAVSSTGTTLATTQKGAYEAAKSYVATIDYADTAVAGQYVSEVDQTDGKIAVTRANFAPSISITAGTSSDAPKVNVTVNTKSGTAQSLTKATTGVYGVTKLSSTSSTSEEGLAATPKGVWAAIDTVKYKVTQTGNNEDKEFPILLKNTNNTTDETATVKFNKVTTQTTINPSTGTISAESYKVANKVQFQYDSTTESLNFVFI